MFTEDQQKKTEFVKHPYKTTKEYIEETLGPGLISDPSVASLNKNYSHCFHNSNPYLKVSSVNNTNFSQSSISSESGLSALHHSQSGITTEQSAVGPIYSPKVSDSFLLYKKLPNERLQNLSSSFNAVNPVSPLRKSFQCQVQYFLMLH